MDKAETLVGFFPEHNKRTHCGGSVCIQGSFVEHGGLVHFILVI